MHSNIQDRLPEFALRLKNEQRAREAFIESITNGLGETKRHSDPNDEARDEKLRIVQSSMVKRYKIELKAIEAALSRIENGTFGICTNCKEDISEKRLDSQIYTPFCFDCAKILGPQKPK